MCAVVRGATSAWNPGRHVKERTDQITLLESEARRFAAMRNGAAEYLWLRSSSDPLPRKPGLRWSITKFGRFAVDPINASRIARTTASGFYHLSHVRLSENQRTATKESSMSDKLHAFTAEQRDQVIKLSKVGAFEINFENEDIVVYAMCEPNNAEKEPPLIEGAQQRVLEEVVRVNFLEVITNAANESVNNTEDRVELLAISWHLKELADWMKKRRVRYDASMRL